LTPAASTPISSPGSCRRRRRSRWQRRPPGTSAFPPAHRIVGAADGPLGNLGTGAMRPGVCGLSLGTSGAVRMAVSEPRVDAGGALFCSALTETVWVVGGAISNGASVVRWLLGSLLPDIAAARGGGDADEAVLELAASVPAGSEGLVMFPYLLPERAPLWDPDLHGAYVGLRRRHTRAHFVRAAVEGVCLQMRLILDSLDELEPRVVHRSHGHWLAYLLQKRRSPAWHGSICSKDRVVCLGFRGVPSGAYLGQLDGTGWTSRLRTSW
jgi:FGGY family of carbohydrate kinases, C-terminal domain